MIHLSVGLGEQRFSNWSGEQGVQLAPAEKKKVVFWKKVIAVSFCGKCEL